jgi:hypothetical protein
MTIKFTTTKAAGLANGIKALVYGRSGAGKTYLSQTAPKPLILSAEAGLLTLSDVDIPVIEIKSIEDLQAAYQWITEDPAAASFETIILDSISEIAEVVLATAKANNKDARMAYGELSERMQHTLRSFRDIPGKHVVFLAKEGLLKDEQAMTTTYAPAMPGAKLAESLPYMFDLVMRVGIGQVEGGAQYRFLQCVGDLQYTAKNRGGRLDAMEPPNLTHVFNKIRVVAQTNPVAPAAQA